jgi:Mn-dependent DtxR family transcriptional regulator
MSQFDILEVLENSKIWLTTNQIAKKMGKHPNKVRIALNKLVRWFDIETKIVYKNTNYHKAFKIKRSK